MKKTAEELMAMAEENGLKLSPEEAKEVAKRELTDEDMDMISGGIIEDTGGSECPRRKGYGCRFKKTGNTRPGKLWGLNWEVKCQFCGRTGWRIWEPRE